MPQHQPDQQLENFPYELAVEPRRGGSDITFAPADRLCTAGSSRQDWIWEGLIAKENITLLTSVWKSGKSTLLSVLLAKMRAGGELGGLAVRPSRTVVISEESGRLWASRDELLQFGSRVEFACRPFRGRPTNEQWQALMHQLVEWHRQEPLDLVVIDPLASFLPSKSENEAGCVMEALLPLQELMENGIGILLLHHSRKAASVEGQAARGSGAITGCADIVVEMNWVGRPSDDDRRRKLLAFSRHLETPRRLVLELNPEGTDYRTLGAGDDFDDGWEVLVGVLEDATRKLNRREILQNWPEDYPKPHDATLRRWLMRAVQRGLVGQEGTGRKNCPFVYWLKTNEDRFESGMQDLSQLPELKTLPGMTARGRNVAERLLASQRKGTPS